MVDKIEGMYYQFGLTDRQEKAVSDAVRSSRDDVFTLFDQFGEDFKNQIATILDGLNKAGTYQINMAEVSAPTVELW